MQIKRLEEAPSTFRANKALGALHLGLPGKQLIASTWVLQSVTIQLNLLLNCGSAIWVRSPIHIRCFICFGCKTLHHPSEIGSGGGVRDEIIWMELIPGWCFAIEEPYIELATQWRKLIYVKNLFTFELSEQKIYTTPYNTHIILHLKNVE